MTAEEQRLPAQPLLDLIFLALDHGIGSVKGGGALVPFVMFETGASRNLNRYVDDTLEESLQRAREAVPNLAAKRYALAYDGFITLQGQKFDVILVEAAERGESHGFIFAQRYRPRTSFINRLKSIGNAAFLGAGPQLLPP